MYTEEIDLLFCLFLFQRYFHNQNINVNDFRKNKQNAEKLVVNGKNYLKKKISAKVLLFQ